LAIAQKKAVCRAALVNLDEASATIMRDSFKQFRIHAVDLATADGKQFDQEKFDAGVLRLIPGCEVLLQALRNSPRNRHIMVYGIAAAGQLLREATKYGINVMLNHPLDKAGALKVVRATHLLVLHEFRRYVRVPVITEVQLEVQRTRHTAISMELSGGGMSMQSKAPVKLGDAVEVSFSLPNTNPITCAATVSWLEPAEGTVGVRFEPNDQRRTAIKRWIEEYLEM